MASDFGAKFDVGVESDVTIGAEVAAVSLEDVEWNDCTISDAREVFDVGIVSDVGSVKSDVVAFEVVEVLLVGVIVNDGIASDVDLILDVDVSYVISDAVIVSLVGVVCDDSIVLDTVDLSDVTVVLDICAIFEFDVVFGIAVRSRLDVMSFVDIVFFGRVDSTVVCDVESGFDVVSETDEVSDLVSRCSLSGCIVISLRVPSDITTETASVNGSMVDSVVYALLIGVCVINCDVGSLLKSSVNLSATDVSL